MLCKIQFEKCNALHFMSHCGSEDEKVISVYYLLCLKYKRATKKQHSVHKCICIYFFIFWSE